MAVKTVTSYKTLKTETQFLKMVLANTINRFGDSVDLIAFQWIIYQITQSPVWIAVISGVNFLPNLILQPIAGVLVERSNKKRIMIICDIGHALITLCVATMLLTNTLTPWLLLLITFLNSSFESFRLPAAISMRPKIINKEKYTVGIGLDSSLSRIVELVGFGIAGFIVAVSPVIAVLIDCASFLLSALTISFIKYKDFLEEATKSVKGFFTNFNNGLKYLNTKRLVLYLIIWGAATNFAAAAIISYQAVYIADCLKLGASFMSFFSISMALGMSLGAFIAPKIRGKIRGSILLTFSGVVLGGVYILLAALPSFGLSSLLLQLSVLLVIFANGFTNGVVNVVYSAMLTENIDEEYIGRVVGVFGSLNAVSLPLGSFLMASLATSFTIPILFLVSAVITFAAYGMAMLFKEFRKI